MMLMVPVGAMVVRVALRIGPGAGAVVSLTRRRWGTSPRSSASSAEAVPGVLSMKAITCSATSTASSEL